MKGFISKWEDRCTSGLLSERVHWWADCLSAGFVSQSPRSKPTKDHHCRYKSTATTIAIWIFQFLYHWFQCASAISTTSQESESTKDHHCGYRSSVKTILCSVFMNSLCIRHSRFRVKDLSTPKVHHIRQTTAATTLKLFPSPLLAFHS